MQMTDALMAEMRGLDIPLFTLRKDLIREDRLNQDDSSTPVGSELLVRTVGYPGGKVPVRKSELANLQRRMLELLEDLCKE
jgi:hypothetical protein